VNLRQLEYFVVIAEERSFTAAAERLFVTQPALSQQIGALERELGGPLLERLPRGVRLTAAGQGVLEEARAVILHSRRVRRAARMALDLEAGQLEIAAATSAAAGLLPAVLSDWQQQFPAVEVSLLEFPHRRALDEAVRDGAGDIAIGSLPENWQGPIERLGWEEFVLVLPDGDPLLGRRSVPLAKLADRRWVHFVQSHGLAEVVDVSCASAGFSPRVALRTSQVAAAPQFAASGLGPTLVPAHVIPSALQRLARPASPRLIRAVVAFSRGDWAPITEAFLAALRRHPLGSRVRGATDLG
jgi:DNA-binding transcriptional LysR family regulator